MTHRRSPAWLLLLLVGAPESASADHQDVILRDGARLRQVTRLAAAPTADGLRPVAWRDLATGRAAPAWVGRRAVVQTRDPAALAALGVRTVRPLMPSIDLWLVESDAEGEDGLALAERLQRREPALRQALPDLHFQRVHHDFAVPPNDPRYVEQWFYQRVGMEDAWRLETGKASVTIVVIDDGCDMKHPDLVDKVDPGKDVIDGDDDPSYFPNAAGNNHGTACAGLVGASTNNGVGVAGACPGCRIRCVRFLPPFSTTPVPMSADIDAFQFVLDVDAAVASNSWGFTDPMPVPQPLADAIGNVYDHGRGGLGALVVFAAGNDNRLLGTDELESVRGVTTVGAVNNFDELAQFSNYGPAVDVVAPTGTMTTDISGADGADPGDYTTSFGGTSSACPIVAGIYGLLVSAAPDRTAPQIEEALRATAKQSPFATPDGQGHDDQYGFGLVQPAAALRSLSPPDMAMPPMPMPPPRGCGCSLLGSDGLRGSTTTLALALLLGATLLLRRRARAGRAASRRRCAPN